MVVITAFDNFITALKCDRHILKTWNDDLRSTFFYNLSSNSYHGNQDSLCTHTS